jgi:hypothetical protein
MSRVFGFKSYLPLSVKRIIGAAFKVSRHLMSEFSIRRPDEAGPGVQRNSCAAQTKEVRS